MHALRPEITRVSFSERPLAYRVACMPFYTPCRPYGLLYCYAKTIIPASMPLSGVFIVALGSGETRSSKGNPDRNDLCKCVAADSSPTNAEALEGGLLLSLR